MYWIDFAWLFVLPLVNAIEHLAFQEYPRNVVAIIEVPNGGDVGIWDLPEFCREGTYAWAYDLKVQDDGGILNDETGLNGIGLKCTDKADMIYGGDAESHQGSWGDWRVRRDCIYSVTQHYLVRFRLRVDPPGGVTDKSGATNIDFICRRKDAENTHELPGNGNTNGEWGAWSVECPMGSAICGITTRVQEPQSGVNADDTALNDVKLYCCGDDF